MFENNCDQNLIKLQQRKCTFYSSDSYKMSFFFFFNENFLKTTTKKLNCGIFQDVNNVPLHAFRLRFDWLQDLMSVLQITGCRLTHKQLKWRAGVHRESKWWIITHLAPSGDCFTGIPHVVRLKL